MGFRPSRRSRRGEKGQNLLDFLGYEKYLLTQYPKFLSHMRFYIFLPLFLGASVCLAGAIKDGTLSGTSNGNSITIRWQSDDETNVSGIEIERQSGTSAQFVFLDAVRPKGNNQLYEYVDDSAFRTSESLYRYRVKIVYSNGAAPSYYGPITVTHNVSSVRRTWGSIKAMFR